MTDQGFPNTHTTTTVVQPTGPKSSIHLDLSYIHTKDGRIKCVEIVSGLALNLLGFICILSSPWNYKSRGNWFNTVAMGGFWFSGIMLSFYIFHVPENLKVIPWVKVEFVFCTLWTLFYLIAASLVANWGVYHEAFAAAAFFGFCAMLLYGFDAFLKFCQLKEEKNSVQTINMPPNTTGAPITNSTY